MKRLSALLIVVALVVLISVMHIGCGGSGGGGSTNNGGGGTVPGGIEIIGDNIKLTRVTINEAQVASGYLTIPFTKTDENKFINVVVDLNNDGKWGSYSVNGKNQAEWLVQNMLAKISLTEPNSFSFIFNDFDADGRKNLKARLILSDSPLDASNYPNGWDGTVPNSAIAHKDFVISEIAIDAGNLFSPDPDGLRSGGFSGRLMPKSLIQAAKAADIDVLDTDVPDITQGTNECVPTSTANAISWLSKVYGFEDKMPASIENLLSELKSDFNWDINGVDVNRDFLSGKQKFVEQHGLPISTEQIGPAYDPDIFGKISAKLSNGGIVEIDMEFQNPTGKRVAGHMVTVVGAQDVAGVKYLDIHDPASPTLLDIYKINGTQVVDYRYNGLNNTYIRFAFAESHAECSNIAGSWSGTVQASDADAVGITVSLSQDGCNVTGTLKSEAYFPCDVPPIAITGTVSGNIFSGTLHQSPVLDENCSVICNNAAQSGSFTINGNRMSGTNTVQDCDEPIPYETTMDLTRSSSASSLGTTANKAALKKSSALHRK